MQVPLEITFHELDRSEAVEARVRERVQRLERFHKGITSVHVGIEKPHRHHVHGNLYHVRVEARVPGTELVVSRDPGDNEAHKDVMVAVRDAFDAMERQLANHARRQRKDVKHHEGRPDQGRIGRIFHDRGFGFIDTLDGREIYFHRNSVIDAEFESLETGQAVELVITNGDTPEGPLASTVRPIGNLQLQGDTPAPKGP